MFGHLPYDLQIAPSCSDNVQSLDIFLQGIKNMLNSPDIIQMGKGMQVQLKGKCSNLHSCLFQGAAV